MNDPNNLPFDRILLSPPPAAPDLKSPFGPRPGAGLIDEIPVGPSVLPAPRPPATKPEPPAPKPEAPPVEPPAPVGGPAPKPRWMKDALRDLAKMNPKKRVALAVAGTVVTAAVAINALLSSKNLEPAVEPPPLAAAPASPEPQPAAPPATSPDPKAPDRPPRVNVEPPAPAVPVIPILPLVGDGSTATTGQKKTDLVIDLPTSGESSTGIASSTGSSPTVPLVLPKPPVTPPTDLVLPSPIIPAAGSEPAGAAIPPAGGSPPGPAVSPPKIPSVAPPGNSAKKPDEPKPGDTTTVGVPTVPLISPPALPTEKKSEAATLTLPSALPGAGSNSGSAPTRIETPASPFGTAGPERKSTESSATTGSTGVPPFKLPPADETRFTTSPARTETGTAPTAGSNPNPNPPVPLRLGSPPTPPGGLITLDKQPGVAGVSPARSSSPPRTDFDLDLHEPKAGETYASISRLHYGDARYAEALRTFNRNLELGRGGVVEVPPLYVLRRLSAPAGGAVGEPGAIRGVDWSPAPGRSASPSFEVTRDGMTMWDVAEEVLGDRRQWKRVADANPGLDPNGLTRGTRLRLPPR
jgi:hypothetical protein